MVKARRADIVVEKGYFERCEPRRGDIIRGKDKSKNVNPKG
jgi:hypothetical protein